MNEISKLEIDAARREIDILLIEAPDVAFDKMYELNEKCQHAADFYLGVAYFSGYGVDIDYNKALKFFQSAILLHDDLEGQALYFIGLHYQIGQDFQEALRYHAKAYDKDYEMALEQAATCLYAIARDYRNMAAKTFKADEFTFYNATAIEYALQSISLFSGIVDDGKLEMQLASWCCFGRAAEFLYTVACRGEFTTEIKQENNFLTYLSSGLDIFNQRNDLEFHERYWKCLVAVCSAMDNSGYEILGEYFRALGSLVDSELHHSAQAFYRARWHMKRIGELRERLSLEAVEQIHGFLSDIDVNYERLSKKYGALTDGMIRNGEYPALEPSYPDNEAPEVESCQGFMRMYNSYQSDPSSTKQPPESKPRGGLFGLFKR